MLEHALSLAEWSTPFVRPCLRTLFRSRNARSARLGSRHFRRLVERSRRKAIKRSFYYISSECTPVESPPGILRPRPSSLRTRVVDRSLPSSSRPASSVSTRTDGIILDPSAIPAISRLGRNEAFRPPSKVWSAEGWQWTESARWICSSDELPVSDDIFARSNVDVFDVPDSPSKLTNLLLLPNPINATVTLGLPSVPEWFSQEHLRFGQPSQYRRCPFCAAALVRSS